MNWDEVISKTAAYLSSKSVPDPEVAAELLAARLLGLSRGFLSASLGKPVADSHLEAMRRGMRRLIGGEPIQYVLGEWDFRSLTLRCDRRALIPRPETEELVTRVLAWLKTRREENPDERPFVVDVGTGTGAIALSLAKEAPDGTYLGVDISGDAIALARENAKLTGLGDRVKFVVTDGLDEFDEPGTFDAIVSNPPYIRRSVCETLDPRVRDWEPRLALDGGESGLDFYDRYLADAINLLRPNGAVFFEIGEDQGESVRKLMFEYGFSEIRIERDFAGHDRYAFATLT